MVIIVKCAKSKHVLFFNMEQCSINHISMKTRVRRVIESVLNRSRYAEYDDFWMTVLHGKTVTSWIIPWKNRGSHSKNSRAVVYRTIKTCKTVLETGRMGVYTYLIWWHYSKIWTNGAIFRKMENCFRLENCSSVFSGWITCSLRVQGAGNHAASDGVNQNITTCMVRKIRPIFQDMEKPVDMFQKSWKKN